MSRKLIRATRKDRSRFRKTANRTRAFNVRMGHQRGGTKF